MQLLQRLHILNTILLSIFIFIVAFMVTDLYLFKKEGDRFTYCDGVHLYALFSSTSHDCVDDTPFNKFLEKQ